MPYIVRPENVRNQIINPLPQKYVDAVINRTLYLVNISDQDYVFHRTYGCYVLPGCQEGDEYIVAAIGGRIAMIDDGDSKFRQLMIEAEDIAVDLAAQANDGMITLPGHASFGGVFVSETEKPDAKVLAKMVRRLEAFFDDQIALADKFYDNPKDHASISDLMRRAAKARHQKRPWTFEPTSMVPCVACKTPQAEGIIICPTCSAIQPGKEAAARKYFPERFAEVEPEHRPSKKASAKATE